MRNRLSTWVTPLVVASASACAQGTGPDSFDRILGRWDWVESSGGIAGVTQTPASTGHSMLLQFLPVGQVRLFEDGALVRTVTYSALEDASGDFVDVAYNPPLMGFASQTATFPTDGELVLTDPCCDGFTYRYVRAP